MLICQISLFSIEKIFQRGLIIIPQYNLMCVNMGVMVIFSNVDIQTHVRRFLSPPHGFPFLPLKKKLR
jgi:hypothetical protein